MGKDKGLRSGSSELRSIAEERLRSEGNKAGPSLPKVESQRLLHELQVHQIELELQNEELRHAREEMEAQLVKYSDLYDFAPVGYFTLDHRGIIRAVNLTGAGLLGVERTLLITRRLDLFISEEIRPLFNDFLNKVFASETKETCEVVLLKERHSPLFVQVDAVVSESGEECRVTVIDIAERKRAEEALRIAKEEWERTFASVPDLIAILGNQHRILRVNKAMARRLGLKPEECAGLHCYETIHGTSVAPDFCPHSKTMEDGREHSAELHLASLGGDFLVTTTPLLDDNGECIGSVHIAHDITERKRAEEIVNKLNQELENRVAERTKELAATIESLKVETVEREKIEQQLLQSQKMESIGLLAGGVAHDFNNLLTGISGYGQIIQDSIPEDNELLQECVGQLQVGVERAVELTRNLLAFSRKQVMNRKPVIIDAVIENAGKFIRRVIGEDIDFRIAHSGKELFVMADTGQIEQVLMNLSVNARDAMPHGGCLSIATGMVTVKEGTQAQYDLSAPGNYVRISFTDTGSGIDKTSLERIFEPFYTTKDVGKGTGLGLSIVHGIVKQHDGSILVSSGSGKGTTFDIYLPLIEGRAVKEEAKLSAPVAGGTETLLIAEDEEIVKAYLKRTLEKAGYRVIVAGDGNEAVARFREHDDISLVLSDVVMPGKNGKEILAEIKEINPEIKVIFISGYTADIIQKRGIIEEGVEFVTKPFSKNQVLLKVREVLDRG